MRYKRSISRDAFDGRIKALLSKAIKANRLSQKHNDIRDIVFQCCILQMSASMESYIKLMLESWAFCLRTNGKSAADVPKRARAHTVAARISNHFSRYSYSGDERELNRSLEGEGQLWRFLCGLDALPTLFGSDILLRDTKYPSVRNLKKLFARIGIDDIFDRLGAVCRMDVELKVEGFQSLRTALAHEAPPNVTLMDVKNYGKDMIRIVGAIDRVVCQHLSKSSGSDCWN